MAKTLIRGYEPISTMPVKFGKVQSCTLFNILPTGLKAQMRTVEQTTRYQIQIQIPKQVKTN